MNIEKKKLSIICFSNIDWGFIFQRHQHMMNAFLKSSHINKIIYVETLGSRKVKFNREDITRVFNKLISIIKKNSKKKDHDDSLKFDITILSPIAIPIMNSFFYKINELLLNWKLSRATKKIGLKDENIIAWVNLSHPSIYNFIKKRSFNKVVYDCIDDIKSIPNMNNDIVEYEKKLIKEADVVFATATSLYKMCKRYNENVHMLPNAVPEEFIGCKYQMIKDSRQKIVGYVGTVYEWFDDDILYECVQKYKNVDFYLVGPIRINIDRFAEFKNVKFIGKVDYGLVEKYIESFDVCLIPFKINELTINTNPVKVYEYFAKGKPIVTTNLPELDTYEDYLYIARDRQDFLKCLDRALNEKNEYNVKERIRIARENTWDIRVKNAWEKVCK